MAYIRIPLRDKTQRPLVPPARVVVLSEAQMAQLGRNATIVNKLPFFRTALKKVGKRCCGGGVALRAADAGEMSRIRQELLKAPPESIVFLKNVLHASQLVVYVNSPKGVEKHVI